MTAPAQVVVEFKSQTYAAVGSQAQLTAPVFNNYASIVSPDGNYLYYVADSDLNVVDISDPASPSSAGTASAVDGLCGNQAVSGLVFDSTGRYLYVPNGTTSMYTLDLDLDPEEPALDHTLTVTTAASGSRHVILRRTSNLVLVGDSSLQLIDISTPDTPSIDSTTTATTTIGVGITRGYVSPDNQAAFFPEMDTGSPAGQIGVWSIGTAFGEMTPIDLPDFTGPETVTVSGAINFDSSIDASRFWFVGKYTASSNSSYFWMAYEKGKAGHADEGNNWAESAPISDVPVSGIIAPTHYLANEPYDAVSWGTVDSEIAVELSAPGIVAGARMQFWKLDANEIFPLLVIKEGGHRSEILTGFRAFNSLTVQSGLLAGAGVAFTVDANDSTTIFGAPFVYVPSSVTVTDLGWQDISADVRPMDGISVSYGITGSGVFDRIAQTGAMSFRLNNFSTVGLYSPGHASLKANFVIGAPIRLQISDVASTPLFTKFLGRIESITPGISIDDINTSAVTCVDAMDVLSRAKVKGLQARTKITASRIVEIVIDAATGLPITSGVTNAIDSTPDVYEFALDGIEDDETSLIKEVGKAVKSERGFFYPAYQHDDVGTDGGFRLESRETRINSPVFATPVVGDGTVRALLPEHSSATIINRGQGKVFPRESDSAATTILFTLGKSAKIKKGATLTFTAPYKDPAEQASRVSGTEMAPPIATTDYKFTSRKNGGTSLVANLAVNVEFGASSAEVSLTNLGFEGWVSLFRLKGKGLYSYKPLSMTARDSTSIVKHGLSDAVVELPHESDLTVAAGVVDKLLTAYASPRTFIRSASIVANKSTAALTAFINGEIGDKYFVVNTALGIDMGTTTPFILETSELDGTDELADEAGVYVIHSSTFTIMPGNTIEATWGLFPANVRL